MTDSSKKQKVSLAKIGRPRGLKGELRIDIFNPDSDLFKPGKVFHVESKVFEKLTVKSCNGQWCWFEEIQNPEDARKVVGCELFLFRDELPSPKKGTYYHVDLIGCEIFSQDTGEKVGILKNILYTVSNDVWIVESANGEEHMIPLLHQTIVKVDIENRKIHLNIPEVIEA